MPDVLPFEKLSADHLRLILEAGQIGIWELDIASGVAVRNRRHDAIFGYDQPLDEWTFDMFNVAITHRLCSPIGDYM